MLKVITFADALKASAKNDRSLLIGNGFSAQFFNYKDLLEKSGFPENSPLRKLFAELGSVDFELAMRSLEDAALVEKAYDNSDRQAELIADVVLLREGLVHAIRETHPRHLESDEFDYKSCLDFLKNFQLVFTLNYDLLLYWACLQTKHLRDGFGLGEDKGAFRGPFKPGAYCEVYNLHGGLQLFDDGTGEVQKAQSTGGGVVEQISTRILSGRLPIYVSGRHHPRKNAQDKLSSISSSLLR